MKRLCSRLQASAFSKQRVVAFLLMGCYGVIAATTFVYAGSLPKQSANLVTCAEKMDVELSLEERLRICKVQRSRSLLFKGEATSCSDPQDAVSVTFCSLPDSVSATGKQYSHTPSGETSPIVKDQVGQVYAGYEFWLKGGKYRMTKDNQIQHQKNNQWEVICQLNLAKVDCLYEAGSNSSHTFRSNPANIQGKCNYYSLHFYPALTYMHIVETTSHISSKRVRVPMFPDRWDFSCMTDQESFRKSWVLPPRP